MSHSCVCHLHGVPTIQTFQAMQTADRRQTFICGLSIFQKKLSQMWDACEGVFDRSSHYQSTTLCIPRLLVIRSAPARSKIIDHVDCNNRVEPCLLYTSPSPRDS